MTSVFDPNAFLQQTHTAGFATQFTPIPEGEYLAQLVDGDKGMAVRTADTKDGVRFILNLQWQILDDKVKELTGMASPSVRQEIWLDLDENGRLSRDKNKNVDLGKFLAAIGLNSGDFSFNQIRTAGIVKVKVAPDKPTEDGRQFSKVKAVIKYNGAS